MTAALIVMEYRDMSANIVYTEIAFNDSGEGLEPAELLKASLMLDFFGEVEAALEQGLDYESFEEPSENSELLDVLDETVHESGEQLVSVMFEVSDVFDIDGDSLALGVINVLRSRSAGLLAI